MTNGIRPSIKHGERPSIRYSKRHGTKRACYSVICVGHGEGFKKRRTIRGLNKATARLDVTTKVVEDIRIIWNHPVRI